jgi:predicted transcriptional regulator
MQPKSSTITVRLSESIRRRLDVAAARQRRSRSFLIKEAIEQHLASLEHTAESAAQSPPTLSNFLAMRGAAHGLSLPRTKEEIDAHIRWLRDDD